MAVNASSELYSIKVELNSIITELQSISNGVRNDFTGIGSDKCADCIDNVVTKYYIVRQKLDNINTTSLAEGVTSAFGGTGGGGGFR